MTTCTVTPKLTDRFTAAVTYASELHAHQVRKGSNVPFLSHLLSVSALVLEDGGDEDEAIAALLHDAVEDCGGEAIRLEIAAKFGSRVNDIVAGCTETAISPKPPWAERKQQYIDQIRVASPSVIRVSLADKLHNARSIFRDYQRLGEAVWDNFKGSKTDSLKFYRSLIAIYRQQSKSYMVLELEQIIDRLETPATAWK
jgi:(p)ppGpp synthase/HD superfamily hydrolase